MLLIWLVLITLSLVAAIHNDYCQLNCEFFEIVPHTLCTRAAQNCGAGPKCGPDFRVMELSDADRQYILDIHNYYRNRVAMGLEYHGSQPSASNMRAMNYNRELELIAQCWANTCNGNPLLHDDCRRTAEYEHVGQNLGFINSSIPNINIVKSVKELIRLWYDEVEVYHRDWINDTKKREVKVGHYTQMLWADSSEIGCAATFYTTKSPKKWHHVVFICNYGPGGNYLGAPVYEIGFPAANCESLGLKPNAKYKGLCGTIKKVKDNKQQSFPKVWTPSLING